MKCDVALGTGHHGGFPAGAAGTESLAGVWPVSGTGSR